MDMLSYIGLEERKNHYPDEISGGEKQKVAVLRALVNNPPLIITAYIYRFSGGVFL